MASDFCNTFSNYLSFSNITCDYQYSIINKFFCIGFHINDSSLFMDHFSFIENTFARSQKIKTQWAAFLDFQNQAMPLHSVKQIIFCIAKHGTQTGINVYEISIKICDHDGISGLFKQSMIIIITMCWPPADLWLVLVFHVKFFCCSYLNKLVACLHIFILIGISGRVRKDHSLKKKSSLLNK